LEILDDKKGWRVDGDRTICEKHRMIRDLLLIHMADRPVELQEILWHLNGAYLDGIKLVKALIERKLALPEWEKNNVGEALALRKEAKRLEEELHAVGSRS
jgi:hypothetical protein